MTMFLLPTNTVEKFEVAKNIVESSREEVHKIFEHKKLHLKTSYLKYYDGLGRNSSSIFCLEFIKNSVYFKLQEVYDLFANKFLEANLLRTGEFKRQNISQNKETGKYFNKNLHITLLNTNHSFIDIPVLKLDPSFALERFRGFSFGKVSIDTFSLFES